jgi:hypothetical protein
VVGAAAEGDGNWPRPVPTNLGWSTGINAAMHSVAVAGVHGFPDVPHSAGLIAPRPLLIEAGMHDTGFFIDEQLAAFDHLKRIYDATGAGGDLWHDVHPGEHAFADNKAHEFFAKYL